MKPSYTLLCFLIMLSFCCTAQDNVVLAMDDSFNDDVINLPFKEVVVKDARFDKTKVGCVTNKVVLGIHLLKKRDAVFPDSLNRYLPKIIAGFSAFDSTSSKSLFILIKKFRVAENFMTSVQQTVNNYLTLNVSISFYTVQNGIFNKLFSIDDVLSDYVDTEFDVKLSIQYLKNQRSSIVRKLLYKLMAYKNWNADVRSNGFTSSEIDAAVQKRFLLPVYEQQAKKGLYKTFADFKNASPSVTTITIEYKENKVQKVTDSSDKVIATEDYWGLSDGEKNYKMFRNEFTPLLPCDKSFRILSYRTSAELTGKAIVGDGKNRGVLGFFNGGNKVAEYFDLDMDSGELFLEEISGRSKIKNIEKVH